MLTTYGETLACIAVLFAFLPSSGTSVQAQHCKFLNSDCAPGGKLPPRQRTPELTQAEYLRRCLLDFESRQGGFVPEGHSTRRVKSRSDATSMCSYAIANHNYYFIAKQMPDDVANLKCCLNTGTEEKVCLQNIRAARSAKVNVNFCEQASKAGEPAPKEWNVPAGCEGGPCMVTRGYCEHVGYGRVSAEQRSMIVQSMSESITTYPENADQVRAVLRVCFGER
jgi:hypothetical protein